LTGIYHAVGFILYNQIINTLSFKKKYGLQRITTSVINIIITLHWSNVQCVLHSMNYMIYRF